MLVSFHLAAKLLAKALTKPLCCWGTLLLRPFLFLRVTLRSPADECLLFPFLVMMAEAARRQGVCLSP